MELKITASHDENVGNIAVSDKAFGTEFNQALVHQVVVACLAAERAGTKAQKTRAEVSGGGIKPWRQKGTGRARAGTIRSPLWRKGGVTFAAKPRSYAQKVNKKMYQGALRSILSELVKQNRLILVQDFQVASPKTKDVLKVLHALHIEEDALLITEKMDKNLYLATRNLPYVETCTVQHITPVNLIAYDKVLVTVPAIKQLEEWLA